jgi:hypothetical protein
VDLKSKRNNDELEWIHSFRCPPSLSGRIKGDLSQKAKIFCGDFEGSDKYIDHKNSLCFDPPYRLISPFVQLLWEKRHAFEEDVIKQLKIQFTNLWIARNSEREAINGLTLRAYPNNRVVTRPSEKHEDKASGQNPHRRS